MVNIRAVSSDATTASQYGWLPSHNYDKAQIFSTLGQAGREEVLSDNVTCLQAKVLRIAFLFRPILRYMFQQFRRRESR